MEIKKESIDQGQGFDFGRTSEVYAKYRDIYPECMFQKLADLGIGIKGQRVLDLGTGTGVMAAMNQAQINQFDSEHKKMLQEKYPESFTVKHKIFLTWYKINEI